MKLIIDASLNIYWFIFEPKIYKHIFMNYVTLCNHYNFITNYQATLLTTIKAFFKVFQLTHVYYQFTTNFNVYMQHYFALSSLITNKRYMVIMYYPLLKVEN